MGLRTAHFALTFVSLVGTARVHAADAPPPPVAPRASSKSADRATAERLRARAEAGDAVAARELSDWHWELAHEFQDHDANLAAWAKWWTRGAELGDVVAQSQLARSLRDGEFLPQDLAAAERWEKLALRSLPTLAAAGDVSAQIEWAIRLQEGDGVAKDVSGAKAWRQRAAGRATPMQLLDLWISVGFLSEDSTERSEVAPWLRSAAQRGHPQAQWWLAHEFEKSREAFGWLTKAASQGHVAAMISLASYLRFGWGCSADQVESVRWTRSAAEAGDPRAQREFAKALSEGRGVAKDPGAATYWHRRATEGLAVRAAAGDWHAQADYGDALATGLGVVKSEADAVRWYRRAAWQGHPVTPLDLGLMYESGAGVPANDVLAYAWISIAGAEMEAIEPARVAALRARMSRAEIAEGQRLAARFRIIPERWWDPRRADAATRELGEIERSPRSSGTGFAITSTGYVVTSQHVVASASRVEVVTKDGTRVATVVRMDEANDIAVLKVEGSLPAIPVVSSKSVRLGATVGTVGYPNTTLQGRSPKLSKGEIGSLAGPGDDPRYFQISVAVQPGNSGGPLFDERGNVVGIVAAKLREEAARATSGSAPENVNYAIKSSFLLAFLESIPGLGDSLAPPVTDDAAPKFEDVVKTVEEACVLILVY